MTDATPGLHGSCVIVTGGASYIGRSVAERFLASGASVVLSDIDGTLVEQAADSLNGDVVPMRCDVTIDDELSQLVEVGLAHNASIQAVVTAAVTFDDEALATDRQAWLRALDVNVVSAARLTDIASSHMPAGGSVTYVASISASRSQPNRVVYNTTKAALVMLAKTSAQQLAPKGIRVNAVSPGWTWSRNLEARYGTREAADAFAAEFQPLGRMADPEEVAAAVVYLSSPAASFTTGSELLVDGGYSAIGPEALGQAAQAHPGKRE